MGNLFPPNNPLIGTLIFEAFNSGQLLFSVPPVVVPYQLIFPGAQGGPGSVMINDGMGNLSWAAALPGEGTVTSVAMTVPSFLSISGSPITTAGTLAISLATEFANTVFAGPVSGGAATPTFRPLVAGDIPALPYALNSFTIMQPDSGTSPTASSPTDTLTFHNSDGNLTISGNSGTKTLTFNASASLLASIASKQPLGNYITALTGDVTATGPGSVAATLATVNGSPGTFTYATITVNAKGLVTSASSGTAPVTSVTASGPLTSSGGTTPNISFSNQTANKVFAGPASGGAAAPTFRSLVIADEPVLSGQQFITSGTTYTTPATINTNTTFKFTLIGGGGGSGGSTTVNGRGPGGGGAGGIVVYLTGLTPSTAYTIAIGAGGTAGTNAPTAGGNGGNTTLTVNAVTYLAGGASGGSTAVNQVGGLPGGTSNNGTINISGEWGGSVPAASVLAISGKGGSSPFGMGLGGPGTGSNTFFGAAIVGSGFGAGAGGTSNTGVSSAGAAGTQGCILVEWRV